MSRVDIPRAFVKRDYSLLPAVQQGAITHEEVTTVQIYESIFIINPNLTDEETAGVNKKMQDVVAKQGGEMIKVEDWGKKRLTYEIKKQKRGHYVFFQFKSAPPVVKELERTYKLTDSVIKFMTIRLEKELRVREVKPPKPPKPEAKKETHGRTPAGPPAA